MIKYPIVAAEISNRLFDGPKRSTDLTRGLGFSPKLIYQTLDEMVQDGFVSVQTDLPKFKVYQITGKGAEIVVDSKIKTGEAVNQSPVMHKMIFEMYTKLLKDTEKTHHPLDMYSAYMGSFVPDGEIFLSTAATRSLIAKKWIEHTDGRSSQMLAVEPEIINSAT